MSLSDHRAVFGKLAISPGPKRAARWWFNCALLLFLREIKEQLDQSSVDDPRILWSAVKGFIRDKKIGFASNLNKTRWKHIVDLENRISTLERSLSLNATSDLILEQDLLMKDLNQLLGNKFSFIGLGNFITCTVLNQVIYWL